MRGWFRLLTVRSGSESRGKSREESGEAVDERHRDAVGRDGSALR